jgi:hypothetical protein
MEVRVEVGLVLGVVQEVARRAKTTLDWKVKIDDLG